ERFRVPGFLIGLTIVAVGTSTPELVVSFLSALEGEGDMAVGNVVGSNIANILLILGLCSTVVPLTPGGIDAVTLGAVVLSSLLLFAAAFTFRRRALDRWEGVLFLAIYGAYLWWLLAK
uniref:sodium:calcium antiporter n=1 Tax=Alistipes communis TaxID=2585118 RepID=UPI003A8568E8